MRTPGSGVAADPRAGNAGAPARRRLLLNAVAGMLPLAVGLVLVPILLGGLGAASFGVWSLLSASVGMMATLDLGLAASLFRYFGVNGDRDRPASDRLLNTALLVLAVALAIATALFAAAAPLIASVLHLDAALVPATVAMLRWLGPVLVLATMAAALAARLQSAGRFGLLALAVGLGQATYAGGVLRARASGLRLPELASALVAGQVVTVAVAAVCVAAVTGWRPWRAGLTSVEETREVGRFAWRMQVAGLWGFINLEADLIIVAVLLPVSSLGAYAVGASVAGGLRAALSTLLPPMLGPISRAGLDVDVAVAALVDVQRRWVRLAAGPAIVSIALAAGVAAVLGRGPGLLAGPVAAALMIGHAVNLGTGVLSYLTRVIARPVLEARYGRLSALVNVGVTVALTPAVGLLGVCLGTAAGQVVGSLWFIRVVRGATGRAVPSFVSEVPWGPCAATGAAMSVFTGVVLAAGAGALVSVAALAAASLPAWAGYRVLLTRRSRPGHVRTPRTPLPN